MDYDYNLSRQLERSFTYGKFQILKNNSDCLTPYNDRFPSIKRILNGECISLVPIWDTESRLVGYINSRFIAKFELSRLCQILNNIADTKVD